MDAVILAAGDGARLRGIAARGHKPLLLVNGVPLVIGVLRSALFCVDRAVVVTSPLNHAAIADLVEANDLDGDVELVEYGDTRGPGDSLLTGLRKCAGDDVLVLCADNIIDRTSVVRVAHSFGDVVMGGRLEADEDVARRFTRLIPNGNVTVEGGDDPHLFPDGYARVWLGPLRLPRARAIDELDRAWRQGTVGELKIGPYLYLMGVVSFVEVDCYDVGVPEVWVP